MKKIFIFCTLLTSVILWGAAQSNNYANGNGTIIETRTDENNNWVFRKHIQRVQIGNLALGTINTDTQYYSSSHEENLNIYDKPVLENGKIIGRIKIDDSINIVQVAETVLADYYYYWVNIVTDSAINGWLFCGKYNYLYSQTRIPYFNGRWEILESITTGQQSWTIRKMIGQLVQVSGIVLNIRDMPGLANTNIISKIDSRGEDNRYVNLDVMAATEEMETIDGRKDRWLKINYNGLEGWIFGGYTSVERGGYKYYTPENVILSRLGWH